MHTVILPAVRAGIPLLLLCATIGAGRAHAQEDLRVGSVRVHLQTDSVTGADYSFAVLEPEGGADAGDVVWACGGDSARLGAGVLLADSSRAGLSPVRMVWRFDKDAPVTTVLQRPDDLSFLSAGNAGTVMARARTAERLVVQMSGEAPFRKAAKYRYSLAGVDSALTMMGCGSNARLSEPRARMETLRRLVLLSRTGPGGRPELVVVEDPELIDDRVRLAWHISRNYPPLQRDSGVSGYALLRILVLESGSVDTTKIQVTEASHEAFGVAGARVIRLVRFRPGRANGRPIRIWVTQPIHFELGAPPPSGPPAQTPPPPAPPRER